MASIEPASQSQSVEKIVQDIASVSSRDDCLEKVYQVFDIYGLGHACIASEKQEDSSITSVWRKIPDNVSDACKVLSANKKHPAIKIAKTRHFPFNLFDFRSNFEHDNEIKNLFYAFESNEVQAAYGLPVHMSDNTFVFVVAKQNEGLGTSELLTLQAICTNAVNHILDLEPRPCEAGKSRKLTVNERRIAIAFAQGKARHDISDEMKLSENTIGIMFDQIVKKLSANNISHAIILAMIDGEFGLSDCTPH